MENQDWIYDDCNGMCDTWTLEHAGFTLLIESFSDGPYYWGICRGESIIKGESFLNLEQVQQKTILISSTLSQFIADISG